MRILHNPALLLSLAVVLVACEHKSDARQPDDVRPTPAVRAEVQAAVRKYVDAYNRADASAIMDLYARGSNITVVADGEITRGWESQRAGIDSTIVGHGGGFRFDVGSVDVVALGKEHALAVAPYTLIATTTQGQLGERGALTLVLQRSDSGWVVIHEHESTARPPGH